MVNVEDLLPMPPTEGPPLPRKLGIKWPWEGKEGIAKKLSRQITEDLKRRGLI